MSARWSDETDRDRTVIRLLNMPTATDRVARYLDMPRSLACECAAELEVDNEMLMHSNTRLMRERDEAREACVRHKARVEELEGLIERPIRRVGLPGRARRIARYLQTDDVFTTFCVYVALVLTAAIVIVQVAR